MANVPVDTATLRLLLPVLGLAVFGLMYLGTYRPSRAPYARWWTLGLVGGGTASMVPLGFPDAGDTVFALSHALNVLSMGFFWAAARSLHGARTPWWLLAPLPLAVAAWSLASSRGDGDGAEDLAQIVGVGVFLTLTSWTLWSLLRVRSLGRGTGSLHTARTAVIAMAASTTSLAAFYALRAVVYVTVGTQSGLYEVWMGPEAAVIGVIMWFVVIIYSASELSHLDNSLRWRDRAMRDDLTGLLTRRTFTELADDRLVHAGELGRRLMLVAADFDHFKELNDTFGHAEGDRALRAFGEACRGLLREEDLAGRMGGEEFTLLLGGTDADGAVIVCERLAAAFDREFSSERVGAPTLSFGVTVGEPGVPLTALMARADAALYRAKEQGRDQVVVDSPGA